MEAGDLRAAGSAGSVVNPVAESYRPSVLAPDPPSPADLALATMDESIRRANPERVAAFRLMREIERIADRAMAEVAR